MPETRDNGLLWERTGNAIRSLYQIILYVNSADLSCKLLDHNKELRVASSEFNGYSGFQKKLLEHIHPKERELFARNTEVPGLFDRLSKEVYFSFDCRIRHMNRKYYWSRITLCNTTKEDDAEGNDFLLLVQDIHEVKAASIAEEEEQQRINSRLRESYDRLFEENMLDEQTKCYNRKGYRYYAEKVIEEAESEGKNLFVCVADLNGLKYLNDTYGHAAGDEAIAAVSGELRKASPKGARIVRTGGDEFLIFAALDEDSREPETMEQRVDEGLQRYNEEHPHPYTIGASLGWVFEPLKNGQKELDELIGQADARMYERKKERDIHRREAEIC